MSGTLDRLAALRLASRLARTRSIELQKRGQFIDAESYLEAHVVLEGMRFTIDRGMKELERNGGDTKGGMRTTLLDDREPGTDGG